MEGDQAGLWDYLDRPEETGASGRRLGQLSTNGILNEGRDGKKGTEEKQQDVTRTGRL